MPLRLDLRLVIGAALGALFFILFALMFGYSTPRGSVPASNELSEHYISDWKEAKATVFWVGEYATEDNAYIHNSQSAWDRHWEENFGGVDDPDNRNGWHPAGFTPQENPFYVALPYNDMVGSWRKENVSMIPWNEEDSPYSVLKNRWVEVSYRDRSCFGQWEDVGPYETDDVNYVFGHSRPRNTYGVGAGIDISPAMRDCLKVGDVSDIIWRHVDVGAVPDGPWFDIVTE